MRLFATLSVLLPLIASSFATIIVAREDASNIVARDEESVSLEARQSYGDCIRWKYRKQERWSGPMSIGTDPSSASALKVWSITNQFGSVAGSLGVARQLFLSNDGPLNHKYRVNFSLQNGGSETFWLNSGEKCTLHVGFGPADVKEVTFQDKTG